MKRALVIVLLLLGACSRDVAIPDPIAPTGSAKIPTYFAVKGDWGSGTEKQELVTDQMCAWRARGYSFDTVITTGDNFYDPDGRATNRNFSGPEKCLEGITWRASWGNHDVRGVSTRTVLGARRWYRWSEAGVVFIALDSNQTGSGEQRRWLETELTRARARPVVVYFHHPPYTGSYHPPDAGVRAQWVPLFKRYDVELVLNGHNHDYEHHLVDGIHYVVTGGGGKNLYPCVRRSVGMLECDDVYHFVLLGVTDDGIDVRAIRGGGGTLDSFRVDF